MKKLFLYFFYILFLVSCISAPTKHVPVEFHFPLKQTKIYSTSEVIERIAVSDTWLAVYTPGSVTGVDIESGESLWKMKLAIQADDPLSFVMVDNLLLATTPDQVWVIDQLGQKKRTNLESIDTETKRIIRVASVNRDNIYINRFPDWRLEAYSLSQNSKLWDFLPGRGSTDVFYDDNKDVAYVTTRYNSFYAIDNATGVLLWKNDIPTLRTTYKDGIIYAVEKTEKSNKIKISSFDVKNQKNVWQSEIEFDPSVYFIKIIDNLVIIGGDEGLLAVKKNDGSKVWQTPKGESFMSEPVDYDGVIYDRGTSRTVYAISPDDGNFVGYVTLESSEAVEPMYKLVSGVQRIRNGIVFNTRHDVWKYEKDGSSLQ